MEESYDQEYEEDNEEFEDNGKNVTLRFLS